MIIFPAWYSIVTEVCGVLSCSWFSASQLHPGEASHLSNFARCCQVCFQWFVWTAPRSRWLQCHLQQLGWLPNWIIWPTESTTGYFYLSNSQICHGQIIGFIFPYKGMLINLLRIIYIYIGICTPMEWDGWLFLPFISIKNPSNLTKASFIPSSWMISQSWRLTGTMRLARKRLVFWMRNQQHSPLHCSKESSIHWYLDCSFWFATSLVLWISDAVCHH